MSKESARTSSGHDSGQEQQCRAEGSSQCRKADHAGAECGDVDDPKLAHGLRYLLGDGHVLAQDACNRGVRMAPKRQQLPRRHPRIAQLQAATALGIESRTMLIRIHVQHSLLYVAASSKCWKEHANGQHAVQPARRRAAAQKLRRPRRTAGNPCRPPATAA